MTRPTTLPEPWLSAAQRAGGVAALAERFGITTRTLGRWAAGEQTPSALSRNAIEAYFRRLKLDAPMWGKETS